jgi:hypothetical protein
MVYGVWCTVYVVWCILALHLQQLERRCLLVHHSITVYSGFSWQSLIFHRFHPSSAKQHLQKDDVHRTVLRVFFATCRRRTGGEQGKYRRSTGVQEEYGFIDASSPTVLLRQCKVAHLAGIYLKHL